ncbi:unnamed protein product [Rhodiola kirilowii]
MPSKSTNEMDSEKQPPSVIAMLMGFDTLQQPVKKRERVLSANYLQKTASLHFARKRLPSRRCSSPMQIDVDSDLKDTRKVRKMSYLDSCNVDHQNRADVQDLQVTAMHPRRRRVMKPLKPSYFGDDVKEKISRNVTKSQLMDKHNLLKASKTRFSVVPSKQLKEYKRPKEEHLWLFPSEMVPNKPNASKNIISSIYSPSANRKHADLHNLIKGKRIRTRRYLMAEEATKSTQSETRLHIYELNASSIPCNSGPVSTNLDPAFCMVSETGSVKESYSVEPKIRMPNYKNTFDECNEVCELLHESSPCSDSGRLKDSKMSLCDQNPAVYNSSDGDSVSGTEGCRTQIERNLCALDDIYKEASDLLSEDSVVTCHSLEPLSPTSSEEASRRSPISVLDSLINERVQSNMNCYMNGSSDLYEVYSDGPGMTVSSDDELETSTDTIQDNVKISDVSYLDSLLDEAYSDNDFNYTIQPKLENPINRLMFEIIEKRYGRQVSWPRSETKLLFDRIKLGLKDIIKSCIGIQQIAMPVRKLLSPGWTRQEIEETLWMLLVSQDQEAKQAKDTGSPSKGKKLNTMKVKNSNVIKYLNFKASAGDLSFIGLEDYMDEIIIDIEGLLIDELVLEFVNSASSE